MSVFNIKLSGHVININTMYNYSFSLLSEYITDEPAAIHIYTTQDDIEKEIMTYRSAGHHRVPMNARIESSVLCRKLAEALIDFDILLMHGAVIGVESGAFLFTGNSGIGKTTHIKKWLRNCREAYAINGDKPFVVVGEIPMVCGTPWSGKENIYTNTMVPLKSIIIMERNETNQIQQISFSEAFLTLLQQVYHSKDEERQRKTLRLLSQMNQNISFWRFKFNNYKEDCFDIAYNALVKV